jgi:hypothetical protein
VFRPLQTRSGWPERGRLIREQELSNSANVGLKTALGDHGTPCKSAVVRARLVFERAAAWPFHYRGNLQSFVFFKCGDSKAGPTSSRPRPLPSHCAVWGSSGPGFTISWPFFWLASRPRSAPFGCRGPTDHRRDYIRMPRYHFHIVDGGPCSRGKMTQSGLPELSVNLRTILAIPMLREGVPIGVLTLTRSVGHSRRHASNR